KTIEAGLCTALGFLGAAVKVNERSPGCYRHPSSDLKAGLLSPRSSLPSCPCRHDHQRLSLAHEATCLGIFPPSGLIDEFAQPAEGRPRLFPLPESVLGHRLECQNGRWNRFGPAGARQRRHGILIPPDAVLGRAEERPIPTRVGQA